MAVKQLTHLVVTAEVCNVTQDCRICEINHGKELFQVILNDNKNQKANLNKKQKE